jgi:hypothetical protein
MHGRLGMVQMSAVEAQFGSEIDDAMVIKISGDDNPTANQSAERRFSPSEFNASRPAENSGQRKPLTFHWHIPYA